MSEICTCDSLTLGNLGLPNCVKVASVAKRLIFLHYFKNDGTVNFVDPTATLDSDYFNDRINKYDTADAEVDLQIRWYLTPLLESVTDTRGETTYEEFPSGKKSKVREGVRSFEGFIVDQAAFELLRKVKSFSCAKIGCFIVDVNGNLIGNGGTSGQLRPILIDKATFDPQLVKATDGTSQKIQVKFDFSRLEYDHELSMITHDDMDFDLLEALGCIDITATVSGISTTGLTALIKTGYGSLASRIQVRGLVAADFDLYNVTTAAAIVITSVTESAVTPGSYVFVIPAQTSADVLRLRVIKNGYDDDAIEALTITIP